MIIGIAAAKKDEAFFDDSDDPILGKKVQV